MKYVGILMIYNDTNDYIRSLGKAFGGENFYMSQSEGVSFFCCHEGIPREGLDSEANFFTELHKTFQDEGGLSAVIIPGMMGPNFTQYEHFFSKMKESAPDIKTIIVHEGFDKGQSRFGAEFALSWGNVGDLKAALDIPADYKEELPSSFDARNSIFERFSKLAEGVEKNVCEVIPALKNDDSNRAVTTLDTKGNASRKKLLTPG